MAQLRAGRRRSHTRHPSMACQVPMRPAQRRNASTRPAGNIRRGSKRRRSKIASCAADMLPHRGRDRSGNIARSALSVPAVPGSARDHRAEARPAEPGQTDRNTEAAHPHASFRGATRSPIVRTERRGGPGRRRQSLDRDPDDRSRSHRERIAAAAHLQRARSAIANWTAVRRPGSWAIGWPAVVLAGPRSPGRDRFRVLHRSSRRSGAPARASGTA